MAQCGSRGRIGTGNDALRIVPVSRRRAVQGRAKVDVTRWQRFLTQKSHRNLAQIPVGGAARGKPQRFLRQKTLRNLRQIPPVLRPSSLWSR